VVGGIRVVFFEFSCKPLLTFASRCERRNGRAMQYKGFEVTAFEQTPGKWCARILRANGKPLEGNHRQLLATVTSANLPSAIDALTVALEAIDAAGLFFRQANRGTERFWRVLLRTSETGGRSAYLLAKKKRRRGRVSGQVGITDYILREQELYNLWPAYPPPVTDITK
jgi:hypothetical protein